MKILLVKIVLKDFASKDVAIKILLVKIVLKDSAIKDFASKNPAINDYGSKDSSILAKKLLLKILLYCML